MSGSNDGQRVRLSDGLAVLEVAPAQGGCITAYRWRRGEHSIDWLRPAPGTGRFAPNDSGCFPLVPYSNRIRDGRFRFGGKSICLQPNFAPSPHTIHGHGWQRPWRITDESADRLSIAYDHDGSDWVTPYRAEQRFMLRDGALGMEIAVTNTGNEPMPAGLGLHPYFPRTPRCRLSAPVRQMWKTDA